MGLVEAVKSVFGNYANFSGRARRSEYWFFYLFNLLAVFIFMILGVMLGGVFGGGEGAAGGAMFYGVDLVQNRNQQSKEIQNDIMYLLRQGKKQEIIKELDNLKSKGKLGSTTLSYNTTKDENGNPVYLTADDNNQSQSDYIYNTLVKTINQ